MLTFYHYFTYHVAGGGVEVARVEVGHPRRKGHHLSARLVHARRLQKKELSNCIIGRQSLNRQSVYFFTFLNSQQHDQRFSYLKPIAIFP